MDKYAQVIQLYRQGYTDKEIVEITGICLASVREIIDENCG